MRLKITLLLFALFTGVLSAQTVSIQGGSSYGTITEALTAAVAGDVILVSGTFTEPISIDKSITLKGTNPATDIIQAAASPGTGGTGFRAISIGAATAAALTVRVENLTIRNGNAAANGGGINVDKVTGLVHLNNLIITNNYTTTNGGAVGIAGSNVNITNCSIQNNTSLLDGGAIIAAPNNAAAIDNIVNIKQSLINANIGRNGGGIYINGNLTFGNTYKIAVNIENSTVSNNTANNTSTATALAGGGAICSNSQPWTTNTAIGNVTLNLIHATLYGNLSPTAARAGLQFNSAKVTNFSAYNSIIVGNDDLTVTGPKAINFTNTNIINVVNCIFGGTTLPPTIVSDPVPNTNNNQAGKSAAHAGITGTLTSEGGSTQVFKLDTPANTAVDYCTVATGITIPTVDQRGYSRTGIYDAGAYELGASLSIGDKNPENFAIKVYPNPSKGLVTISGLNNIDVVRVYSVLGSLEKEVRNQSELDISDLSTGIHIMMIESDGQKIVKNIIRK
jgi:Secretion system C-terminal sorting domain